MHSKSSSLEPALAAVARAAPEARRGSAPRRRAPVGVQQRDRHRSARRSTALAPGALAQLRSHRDAFMGYVYVNPHALICARILSRDIGQPVDRGADRAAPAESALALRERLGDAPYYRWVFGESDQLPGLVLDRYGDVVVGQIATAGMEALKGVVEAAVRRVRNPAALFWKNDSGARDLEHLPKAAGRRLRRRARGSSQVREAGLTFSVPLAAGQKTGWFYDQTRQPRAAGSVMCPRRARARCVQLRRRLGGDRAQARAPAMRVRRLLAGGARLRAAPMRRPMASASRCMREDAFDALKAARRAGRALRRRDARPAGVHQAQEGHPAGTGRLPQAQPARARAAWRDEGAAGVLLVLVPPGAPRIWSAPSRPPHAIAGASCRSSRPAASRRTIRCIRPSPKPGTSRPSSAA